MRFLLCIVVLLAVLTIGASTAFAATVSRAGGVITVAGTDANESIDVFYDAGDDRYVFEDDSAGGTNVDFAADCIQSDDDPNDVECQDEDVTRIVMNLGGGNDESNFTTDIAAPATVNGGPGDDSVDGTPQDDVINGDAGEDEGHGRDGADTINAGDGNDGEFEGDDGNDTVSGGAGNDSELDGDAGEDTVSGDAGDDDVDGQLGNDTLSGGTGDDDIGGGAGVDTVRGGADDDYLFGGTETDQLFGEDGDDALEATSGDGDLYDGGNGFDFLTYEFYPDTDAVTVTLDGLANDGANAENDNVVAMEDVSGGPANDTLRGSDASESSIMRGLAGNDTINPGSLEDVVFGDSGDDTIDTRDGFTDRVSCGSGTDTANVDSQDLVAPGCENLTIEQRASARDVPEDVPPTVAFTSPAQGASVAARTTLTATASDDRGVARVLFIDEERTVCTDDTAPYTCDYQPRDEDVGRNTLTAVAIDTANQNGFSTRTVRVPRFRPGISIRVTPRRDLRVPFRFRTSGRITLPLGVTPALGCRGTVTVQIKSRGNTISTRRARVNPRTCRYSSRVTFRVTRRLVTNRLTVRATFGGNDVLVRRLSRRVGVTVRR